MYLAIYVKFFLLSDQEDRQQRPQPEQSDLRADVASCSLRGTQTMLIILYL